MGCYIFNNNLNIIYNVWIGLIMVWIGSAFILQVWVHLINKQNIKKNQKTTSILSNPVLYGAIQHRF